MGKTSQRQTSLAWFTGCQSAQAHILGLGGARAVFPVPPLGSFSGLPGTPAVSAAEVLSSLQISSLQIAGHCATIYRQASISFSLPVYLFCINLLKQHVRNVSLWGKERGLGCACRLLPHTPGLLELAACRSGLFEPEQPEASRQPPGAIFQIVQPLMKNRTVKEV